MASVVAFEMTADEALKALEAKLQCRYNNVRRAFLNVKGGHSLEGDSSLSRAEFRQFLRHTGIDCKGEEFSKLWKMFDSSGDGKLSYAEIQAHFGRIISPAAEGLKFNRPETPRLSPVKQAALAKMMRKKIQDVEATFNQFDTDGSGLISHAEFILALRRLGIRGVGDEESANTMSRFAADPANGMNMEEFKKCVEFFTGIPPSAGALRDEADESIKEMERDLHAKLGSGEDSGAALATAFSHLDPQNHGEVSLGEAKAVLEGLLAGKPSLTSKGVKALVTKYDPDDVGAFLYREWATDFSGGLYKPLFAAEVTKNWVEIPALHAAGLRPQVNPMTHKPYTKNEVIKRAAVKIGMSEAEVRAMLYLVGRKDELIKNFKSYDDRGDGFLLPMHMEAVFEKMNVEMDVDFMDQVVQRTEKNGDGKVNFYDYVRKITNYLNPNDLSLDKMYLEKDPLAIKLARDAARDAALKENSPRIAVPKNDDGVSINGKTMSGPAKRGPGMSNVAQSFGDDEGSVATSNMDLAPTIARMKKVLGSSWSAVLTETLKAEARSHGAQHGGLVSGQVLRDMLASKGLALTSKEVRALSHRFNGGGPVVTREEDGVVDVAALMSVTMKGVNPAPKPLDRRGADSPRAKSQPPTMRTATVRAFVNTAAATASPAKNLNSTSVALQKTTISEHGKTTGAIF